MDFSIILKEDFIKLGQALKAANVVSSGAEAKFVIGDGLVKVNNEIELRRGKKIYDGDVILYNGNNINITKTGNTASSIELSI